MQQIYRTRTLSTQPIIILFQNGVEIVDHEENVDVWGLDTHKKKNINGSPIPLRTPFTVESRKMLPVIATLFQ